MDLSQTDLIYEYHFSEESIMKKGKIKMPDGTVCVLPRQKYTLTKTAVPMAIAEKEYIEPASEPTETTNGVHSQSSPTPSSVLQVRTDCTYSDGLRAALEAAIHWWQRQEPGVLVQLEKRNKIGATRSCEQKAAFHCLEKLPEYLMLAKSVR